MREGDVVVKTDEEVRVSTLPVRLYMDEFRVVPVVPVELEHFNSHCYTTSHVAIQRNLSTVFLTLAVRNMTTSTSATTPNDSYRHDFLHLMSLRY